MPVDLGHAAFKVGYNENKATVVTKQSVFNSFSFSGLGLV